MYKTSTSCTLWLFIVLASSNPCIIFLIYTFLFCFPLEFGFSLFVNLFFFYFCLYFIQTVFFPSFAAADSKGVAFVFAMYSLWQCLNTNVGKIHSFYPSTATLFSLFGCFSIYFILSAQIFCLDRKICLPKSQ